MQDVGRVDVLESPEDLVEEVADVVLAQLLRAQQLEQVALHERLHKVEVLYRKRRKYTSIFLSC